MIPTRFLLTLVSLAILPLTSAQDTQSITGVPVSSKAQQVPLRKSINDLQAAGGAQWDLYIRALGEMQKADSSDPLSYFQIMGIHGKPYIEWNGGGSKKSNGWQGYCPHGEKLFLPWHRPFVLLYEQELVKHAKKLATQYPQRFRYQYISAAEELRSPFWDWGLNTEVPPATVPETLRVNVPKGEVLEEVEVANPVSTFKFPKEALEGRFGLFDSENRTQIYRCPSPDSYPDSANQNIASRPYKRWIYDCFTRAKSFDDFASTGDSGISLEQIHNGIHWDGACGGQFLASEFSAFDPLFMMHHTNVDRLWAYWQAISPNQSIFDTPYSGGARYSTPSGTSITPDTPLNPFFRAEGEFHTTKSVAKIDDFGYTYQGLEYWEKSPGEMRQEATRLINRWYGSDEDTSKRRSRRVRKSTKTRYFANLQIDVEGLERPSTVELYVGGKKAATFVVMEQPKTGILHGSFPLDDALHVSGMSTKSMTPGSTVESIQSSLEVAIVKKGGDRVAVSSVPGLKVYIEDVLVTIPDAEDELPTFGDGRRRLALASERQY